VEVGAVAVVSPRGNRLVSLLVYSNCSACISDDEIYEYPMPLNLVEEKKDKNECHLHLANYQDYSLASQINTVRGIAFFHFITLRECKP
jgi:hypothetical protein